MSWTVEFGPMIVYTDIRRESSSDTRSREYTLGFSANEQFIEFARGFFSQYMQLQERMMCMNRVKSRL